MGDNDTMTCPMPSFSSSEFPANSNLFNSDNQNSITASEEKKDGFGIKEDSSPQLNFQTLSGTLPKKHDESLTSQDLPNSDLHNGHNNPNISHRIISLGEMLQDSEDLPDKMMGGYPSKDKETISNTEKEVGEKVNPEQELSNVPSHNSQENSEQEKTPDDSLSQDFFEARKQESSIDKNDQSLSNQDAEFSEGFDLHLSETQSFITPAGKENDFQTVSESEEESQNAADNEKNSGSNDGAEDVEMSNGSSSNQDNTDSTKGSEQDTTVSKESSKSDNGENQKSEGDIKPESEESLSNGGIEELKEDKVDGEEDDKSADNDTCKISQKKSEIAIKNEEDTSEGNGEEAPIKEEKVVPETTRVSSRQQQKKLSKQEEVDDISETNEESMEVDELAKVDDGDPESSSCSCEPACHSRIKTVSQYLNNACSQLNDFIKLKRREDNKMLKNFLDMLKEINDISDNKEITGKTKISEHALIPEETPGNRKASKRKSNDLDTPLKETPRKRAADDKVAKKPAEKEKKSNVDFKDLKGLAVFAKWPNSGWYYPGKVEELTGSDWKEVNNVTVKFYDGLVRDMKNINILPAYLIPVGSMLCDLEDETEMTVVSCDGSNQNSVDFKLSSKDDTSGNIQLNFNKLAIRANHMKTIKQQLEPTTDVVPKKMHMVSLDNLVSGRRSRARSKKDDSDTEEKTPNQNERRSRSSATPAKKVSTPRRTRN